MVLGPSPGVLWAPTMVNPERLDQWRKDAEAVWERMQYAQPKNWEACTDKHLHFGKDCQFLAFCHQGAREGTYELLNPDDA